MEHFDITGMSRLQQPGRKGGRKSGRRTGMYGKPFDKFHDC